MSERSRTAWAAAATLAFGRAAIFHAEPEALQRIDREVAKYPPDQKQSAVMSALAIAQDEQGWLAPETMDFVASYLGMPPVAVYEVATFYAMYNRQPVGRYKITICTNLPCALPDAVKSAEYLKRSSASASARRRRTASSRSRKASAWAPAATRRCSSSTTSACAASCTRTSSTRCSRSCAPAGGRRPTAR